MRKVSTSLLVAAALAAASPAVGGPALELPALTRIASRLSGIATQRRVTVSRLDAAGMRRQAERLLDREYPRDRQAYDETVYRALGLLGPDERLRPALVREQAAAVPGLYDPGARTLYVLRGTSARAAVVHELVHALQDQAFDLRRRSALRGDRDAGLAASAAVEGDAALATSLLGGRSLAAAERPIAVFLQLEHSFPSTTGLRFASELRNLGGNRAVLSSLRQFPATTSQVFHIDSFLTRTAATPVALPDRAGPLTLERSDTWGELDMRALLAVFAVPRLDRVGDGWAGGRSAVYRDAAGTSSVAISATWQSDLDAAQWAEAVQTWVNEAFDADAPGFPATTPCAADTCWAVGGRSIAFVRRGARTALVVGRSTPQAAGLAQAVAG